MSQNFTVVATESMQGSVSSAARLEAHQYDILANQKNKLEKDDQLTGKQKELLQNNIQDQMDDLLDTIGKKQEEQDLKKETALMEKEQERLSEIYDPDVAKMIQQMEQMVKTAVSTDAGETPSNPDELQLLMVSPEKVSQVAASAVESTDESSSADQLSDLQQKIQEKNEKGYQQELKGYLMDEQV